MGIKEGAKVKPKKNVGLAVILSGFVPGLGQLYNGQPLKAFLFFLTGYTLLVPWPFAVTDAWETATKINEQANFNRLTRGTSSANNGKSQNSNRAA